jgi:DTW domain-containing protein YfiP
VVFLQHPREKRVAVGTARMAHLSLPNSELHLGVRFADHPRVQELAAQSQVALLFPGEGAHPACELSPLRALVVVDGTWSQARKVLARDPLLRALPRVGLTPAAPGNYRIRKEPSPECVSTIEAVAQVLGELEGTPDAFAPLLRPFTYMVDRQLEFIARREGPSRFRRPSAHKRRCLPYALAERWPDVVLLQAEANAQPASEANGELPELVQVVAGRPATGERLEVFLRPRRPLGPNVARHLEVSEALLGAGARVDEGLARLRAFLRPTDLLTVWGAFSLDLLAAEGAELPEPLDLRLWTARVLKGRTGGVEQACERLGLSVGGAAWGHGRAGRRLAALAAVADALAAQARDAAA